MEHIGYIGTYDSANSHGVYKFKFDDATGKLSSPALFYKTRGGKCITLAGKFIIATKEISGKAGIVLLNHNGNTLSENFTENSTPCFTGFYDNMVYTANYHDGVVLIYKIINENLHLVKRLEMGHEAGCHQVAFCDNFIFVPCLNLDCVNIYDITNDFKLYKSITLPKGTGPRHCVFSKNNTHMYLVSELSNQLFHYTLTIENNWLLTDIVSFLPETAIKNSASAAIRLSKDELYIYISTRGSNLLTVFSIEKNTPIVIQQKSCGGDHPRDFMLSPDGCYLLVVNRLSNDLLSMQINKNTGFIENIIDKVPIFEGIGIALN
ncbi:lactonase family protein [Pectinatus sottacetonis]|uniref:lactonase family protein n=1 Tax=Pectinatus sottacetonis TaxID=1002795 RepID=UPI0018C5CBE9|nr:beta-propeller fold lactonase family protein [Pectinatus sottacetonis]